MTTQPEALRLAESAHLGYRIGWQRQVAAELRRLHAENERLHQINFSHEVKLSVRGYEIQIADLEAQRDALLEALRALVRNEGLDAYSYLDKGIGIATAAGQRWLNARAAIKAVEETK